MRSDTVNFIEKNKALTKHPRLVLEIAFDDPATDLIYVTSHNDCAVPSGATVYYNALVSPSSTSQKLNPIKRNSSIGNLSATILDEDSQFTTLFKTKLDADLGLRHKRVRLYLGYKDLEWADYALFGTQIIDDYSFKDGVYKIQCKDIQRTEQKNIFEPKTTNATSTIQPTDTTINVASTTDFEMVAHGTSYSDAPSTTVGYFRINDEVISYTGKTATTFTGCTRGVLNTRAALHEVDTSVSDDRKPKITEFIYLEMPVVKLIYAILTGSIYGTANVLPDHWHLNISTTYVATSKFTSIGNDLWNISDDTLGKLCFFKGLKKTDGKRFIEEKLQPMIGCFLTIQSDGQLGIKRFARTIASANPVRIMGEDNVVSYGELKTDHQQVHNFFIIDWNYVLEREELTRRHVLIDQNSIDRHGKADPINLELEGLDGSRHTLSTINNTFDFLRDRYAGPPELLNITTFFSENDLEVGDIIRVNLDNIRDSSTGTSLDRSFEIQRKKVDLRKGVVQLSLFGSTESASAITPTAATYALDNGVYSTTSLQAGNKLDAALTTTLTGGVLHLDTTGSLTGQTSLPGASNSAVYWYDGDVQIDAGVTITIDENVILLVMGNLQINGTIDGKGQGIVASANGTAGGIGNTKAGGSMNVNGFLNVMIECRSAESPTVEGTYADLPLFNLEYDGGTDFAGVTGYPTDLRGSSGATGGAISNDRTVAGGAGGDGGAGLIIIARGVTVGGSGVIDLSGTNGTAGSTTSFQGGSVASSAGGGGAPGGLLVLLDGSSAIETDVITNFTADLGESPTIGTPPPYPGWAINTGDYTTPVRSYYDGFHALSLKDAHSRIMYIPANSTAEADVDLTTSKPTSVSVVEQTNTPQTPAENLTSIEVTVTPPADSNYSHSNVYWKLSGQPDTAYEFGGVASTEAVLVAAMDGSAYNIKTVPVSIYGVESDDYDVDNITVTTGAGGVDLGAGNYIRSGQTAYDTGTGFWIGNVSGTIKASFGDSGGDKILFDGGNITLTGSITAAGGTIGGWSISSTAITKNNITLDSANERIQAGPSGATYVRISANGIQGVDSVLGTVFDIPTDGSGPVFASGTINTTTYNISTSGILRTSDTVGDGTASSNGVLINETGVKCFPTNASNPNIHLDAATGKLTLSGASNIALDTNTGAISIGGSTFGTAGIQLQYNSGTERFYVGDGSQNFVKFDGTNLTLGNQVDLNINSTTFGNQGIQLQYNSGTPRFYVGDGDEQYFKFDGTDVILGEETTLLGVQSYPDDSTFIPIPIWLSTDGLSLTTTGSGTVYQSAGLLWVGASDNASGDTGAAAMVAWTNDNLINWGSDRKFKIRLRTSTPGSLHADHEVYIFTGLPNTDGFGFWYDNGTWKTLSCHGSTCTSNTVTGIADGSVLESVLDNSGSREVRFYVDGTLKNTHTTNIPTAVSTANVTRIFDFKVTCTVAGAGSDSTLIGIGDTKMLVGY